MSEPTITIPLSFFRELALGYRYSSYAGGEADNLRDKCVLRMELVELIKNTPQYENYFYIQNTSQDNSTLPLIWDKQEWKRSGEKRAALQAACEVENQRADKLTAILREKIPMMPRDMLRRLALDYVRTNADLTSLGIKIEEL